MIYYELDQAYGIQDVVACGELMLNEKGQLQLEIFISQTEISAVIGTFVGGLDGIIGSPGLIIGAYIN